MQKNNADILLKYELALVDLSRNSIKAFNTEGLYTLN